eukprot:TRINITY_DN6310_c0_g2_i2.p1 TRINITY_DN6310_c0_g2~~TRINITY_DN6310_c0_g2_i2.p1  ORF type:complete len:197 (-),score=24.24 TRINITY_DN6310_c0_g2_i2:173-763(-)
MGRWYDSPSIHDRLRSHSGERCREIEFPSGIISKKVQVEYQESVYDNLPTPKITPTCVMKDSQLSEDAVNFLSDFNEWLGLLANDCLEILQQPDLSAVEVAKKAGPCSVFRWTGFIHPIFILNLYSKVKEHLGKKKFNFDWVNVTVWGFDDAPVSWKMSDHNYFYSGENNYSLLLLRGDPQISVQIASVGPLDHYS